MTVRGQASASGYKREKIKPTGLGGKQGRKVFGMQAIFSWLLAETQDYARSVKGIVDQSGRRGALAR